jgi:hypothetical protein
MKTSAGKRRKGKIEEQRRLDWRVGGRKIMKENGWRWLQNPREEEQTAQAKERQLREQKPHLRSKTNRTQNGKQHT